MLENTYGEIKKAQEGNSNAMNNLVNNNMGLVYNITKRFIGRGFEIEDLNQIGAMGLIKAIKKFDIEYKVQLSTYAVPFIIGEIKRYIRDDGKIKVSRSLKELAVKIKQLQKEYLEKNGEEIKLEKIAKILNVTIEDVVLALEANDCNIVTSINTPIYNSKDGDEVSIGEMIANKEDEEVKITNKLTIEKLIKELNDKEKTIVILRYFKGKTQTEVAKKIGISQVQVSRIEKRILQQMKEKLVI